MAWETLSGARRRTYTPALPGIWDASPFPAVQSGPSAVLNKVEQNRDEIAGPTAQEYEVTGFARHVAWDRRYCAHSGVLSTAASPKKGEASGVTGFNADSPAAARGQNNGDVWVRRATGRTVYTESVRFQVLPRSAAHERRFSFAAVVCEERFFRYR